MAKFLWDSVRGHKWESESASPVNWGVSYLLFYKEKLCVYSFILPSIHSLRECMLKPEN